MASKKLVIRQLSDGLFHVFELRKKKDPKEVWRCGLASKELAIAVMEDIAKIYDDKLGGTVSNRKAVRCIETGKVYKSKTDASLAIGCSHDKLSKFIRAGLALEGFHYEEVKA